MKKTKQKKFLKSTRWKIFGMALKLKKIDECIFKKLITPR